MEAKREAMFKAGTAFWVRMERPKHLWIIISDPLLNDDNVLYVNLTTFDSTASSKDAENDRACILHVGDHPFITHDSCIYYYGAQTSRLSNLEEKAAKGELKLDQPADSALLARIRECAEKSIHMIPDHFQILIDQGLV